MSRASVGTMDVDVKTLARLRKRWFGYTKGSMRAKLVDATPVITGRYI